VTIADTVQLLVQTGALGLLWLVLRAVRDVMTGPLALKAVELLEKNAIETANASEAFGRLEAKIDALTGRGVCPLLEARSNGRPTEPSPEVQGA